MKNPQTNVDELNLVINEINNVSLRRFIQYVFSPPNLLIQFMGAPGATTKNHHSYPGGLAYHVVHAARLGGSICEHYQSLGLKIDKDLVIAGILLHDIGKIMAYEVKGHDENGIYQINKTQHERLYHHIPTGILLIYELINKFNNTIGVTVNGYYLTNEYRDKLLHIILSHHGRKSWSSPVIPQFLEAYIVHIVEFMDGMIEKYSDGKVPTDIYDH